MTDPANPSEERDAARVPGTALHLRDRPDLRGKVALVTGSSRGLGAATAVELARAGADVVVTYRKRADEAEAVADEIRGLGREAWVRQLDMGSVEAIEELFGWISEGPEPGRLDLLVLSAAATSFKPLLEAEPRHLERTYAISTVGFLRAVQLAVPLMQAVGGGTIIGVSGADTRTYIPAHGILAGAKAAMEAQIRYLACELGPLGIGILGVNPGTIMGESIEMMLGPELYALADRTESSTHPLREAATPETMAEPIVMLCGPAAKWLHGTIVDLDGGSIFAMCGRWMHEGTRASLATGKASGDDLGPSVA